MHGLRPNASTGSGRPRQKTQKAAAEESRRRPDCKNRAELGNKVTAVERVNNEQAQQIRTVTAAQGTTAAGLEAEKKARADGDRAEAAAR